MIQAELPCYALDKPGLAQACILYRMKASLQFFPVDHLLLATVYHQALALVEKVRVSLRLFYKSY